MFPTEIESKALLLHRGKHSGAVDLTVHDVVGLPGDSNDTPRFTLGAGRVLGHEEKAEMVSILNEDVGHALSLHHERLIARTAYAVAWWIPAARRELVFRVKGTIAHVSVAMPTIVAIYCRGRLYFAAVKGHKRQRPSNDTPLYAVPLPNLHASGTFCSGNAPIARGASESNIPAWEAFLFDSVNTHLGGQDPLKGMQGTYGDGPEQYAEGTEELVDVFRSHEASNTFPTRRLVPLKKTLSEWMTGIDEGRSS